MLQHVLAVAGTVAHAAQQLDQIRVHAVHVGLQNGALAVLLDLVFNLTLRLLNRLLDSGRVDSAVLNQALQRNAGNLTLDRVVAGKGNRLRGVVDNQVDAGQRLQGADVASLAADDAALHLVVWQRHNRDGHLADIVGSALLNGGGDDLLGLLLGFVLKLLLVGVDLDRLLVHQLVFQVGKQVLLGLLGGVAGDLFQRLKLLGLDLVGLAQLGLCLLDAVLQGVFLLLQVIHLAVDGFFLLLDASFQALHLVAALLDFLFYLVALLVDLVLCLHQRLFFLDLSVLDGVADDAFCLFLGGAKLGLRHLFAVLDSQRERHRDACCQRNEDAGQITDHRTHENVLPPLSICPRVSARNTFRL